MLHVVTSYHGHNPKNAVAIIITNSGRVVTFERRDGCSGFPGGRIEQFDKSPFDATKRETMEEAGWDTFPLCDKIISYMWKGHTAIFVCFTSNRISRFRPSSEMKAMHLTRIAHVKNALNNRESWKFRHCEIESSIAIFNLLY